MITFGFKKILLIDDDRDEYVITDSILSDVEGLQYSLDWVSSFEMGLQAVLRNEHDVCLVDYRLGKRDGLQFLREAIAQGCQAPIILLTGQGDREIDMEAMEAGASDYLDKNRLDADLLERAIRYSVERKRADIEKTALEEQLIQAQKLEIIGQLAGGIAHDFNNIVTPISGYAQMGVDVAGENSRERQYFQEIKKAGDRAANLISQLLTFSSRQPTERVALDLNDLVFNVESMLTPLIGEDIEFVIKTIPEPALVNVNPGQLEQVTTNLVVNARDSMSEGGTLLIETSLVKFEEGFKRKDIEIAPGDYVLLEVSDTGTGMSEEIQARIFEPFFTTKEKGKGTGLGLSTCYGIVSQNQGHILVYSELDMGTIFKIYLPRINTQTTLTCEHEPFDYLPRGNETILLVEDDVLVRNLANSILSQQGYNILEANNGREALQLAMKLSGHEFHLLLTDVVMPFMSGRILGDRLKHLHPEAKVLYTSGYSDEVLARHGVLDLETHFIQKPFSAQSLTYKVRDVLDGKTEHLEYGRKFDMLARGMLAK